MFLTHVTHMRTCVVSATPMSCVVTGGPSCDSALPFLSGVFYPLYGGLIWGGILHLGTYRSDCEYTCVLKPVLEQFRFVKYTRSLYYRGKIVHVLTRWLMSALFHGHVR